MRSFIVFIFLLIFFSGYSQSYSYLITGTYTSGQSEGIYVFRINASNGEATQAFVAKGIRNPSFIAVSPDQEFIYAVEELKGGGDAGKVVAFTGSIKRMAVSQESLTNLQVAMIPVILQPINPGSG